MFVRVIVYLYKYVCTYVFSYVFLCECVCMCVCEKDTFVGLIILGHEVSVIMLSVFGIKCHQTGLAP